LRHARGDAVLKAHLLHPHRHRPTLETSMIQLVLKTVACVLRPPETNLDLSSALFGDPPWRAESDAPSRWPRETRAGAQFLAAPSHARLGLRTTRSPAESLGGRSRRSQSWFRTLVIDGIPILPGQPTSRSVNRTWDMPLDEMAAGAATAVRSTLAPRVVQLSGRPANPRVQLHPL
jgi:hypothetical protein